MMNYVYVVGNKDSMQEALKEGNTLWPSKACYYSAWFMQLATLCFI